MLAFALTPPALDVEDRHTGFAECRNQLGVVRVLGEGAFAGEHVASLARMLRDGGKRQHNCERGKQRRKRLSGHRMSLPRGQCGGTTEWRDCEVAGRRRGENRKTRNNPMMQNNIQDGFRVTAKRRTWTG